MRQFDSRRTNRGGIRILSLMFFLFATQVVFACLWVPGTTQEGKIRTSGGEEGLRELRRALRKEPENTGEALLLRYKDAPDFSGRISYAAGLVYLGKYAEAVDLLQKLEAEKPGEYHTAANLGTAYELARNNQKALQWISEGIKRNSESHFGTEWLHVKLLEAKLAAETNANYFAHHTILDLQAPLTNAVVKVGARDYSVKEVYSAYLFQLMERLQFVKEPDPVVAAMLFDFAVLEAALHSLEGAKGLLKMAQEFGFPGEKVTSTVAHFDMIIAKARFRERVKSSFVWGSAVLALLFVIGNGLRRQMNQGKKMFG